MTANESGTTAAQVAAQDMVAGTFDTHEQAEQVVDRLLEAGIRPGHISIVARGFEAREKVTGFVTTGEVAGEMARAGAWTGGLFGLLAGSAFLWVPAVGPLVVLGPLVTTALGALQGGAIGGLMGAILGKGMEEGRVLKYQADLQAGKFLVVVHGTPEELEKVRQVMGENQGQDVSTYTAQAA